MAFIMLQPVSIVIWRIEKVDANLILDRKNLLSIAITEDIQGVITVLPYSTVEVEKDIGPVGINVLVRRALLWKDVDYG